MSAENEPVPAVRASHADREAVVARLQQASGEGRLTLAEFDERAAAAYEAATVDQLRPLTADLPGGDLVLAATPAAAPATVNSAGPTEEGSTLVAVMGGVERKGRWRPGRRMSVVCVMGGAEIDYREAEMAPGELRITVVTIMGGADVVVPEGMRVEIVGGFSFMGGKGIKLADVPVRPELPVLKVTAWALMGGIEVKSKPPKTPKPPKPPKRLGRA